MIMTGRLPALAALCIWLWSAGAAAEHGGMSPMAPRQLNPATAARSYSYGLDVLPGNALDAPEPFNRAVGWRVNYGVFDRFLLRPAAHAYSYLPAGVQTGVGHVLSNLGEINNVVNHLLVGEPGYSLVCLWRFVINSTAGLAGIFDVATSLGLEARPLTMSTVLGRGGADQGAYLMIPALGPATERDLHGRIVDNWPYVCLTDPWVGVVTAVVGGIHARAQLIGQEALIDDAVDPYAQTRQFYLAREEGLVDPDAAARRGDEAPDIEASYLEEVDE